MRWRVKFKNEKIAYKNRHYGLSIKLLKWTPETEYRIREMWKAKNIFDEKSF